MKYMFNICISASMRSACSWLHMEGYPCLSRLQAMRWRLFCLSWSHMAHGFASPCLLRLPNEYCILLLTKHGAIWQCENCYSCLYAFLPSLCFISVLCGTLIACMITLIETMCSQRIINHSKGFRTTCLAVVLILWNLPVVLAHVVIEEHQVRVPAQA